MSDRISIQTAVQEDRIDEYLEGVTPNQCDYLHNFIETGPIDVDSDVKEEMQEWTRLLKSGQYKQGDSEMLNESKYYCCLGVAGVVCELDQALMIGSSYPSDLNTNIEGHPLWSYLTNKKSDAYSLACANDGGFTFKEIADLIEWKYNL